MKTEALRKSKLLKDLTTSQWHQFVDYAKTHQRTYGKGQIIYLEGEACQAADFILEGRLHVKRHDIEGRTFMIERFVTGDMIGANLLFSSESIYPMTIIAERDCRIVSIRSDVILDWCQSNKAFLQAYLNEISDKTKVLVGAVKKISTGTLREKLVAYFEELVSHQADGLETHQQTSQEQAVGHASVVTLPVTKKELAERYGVARTSLSRELKRMEEDGLIVALDSRRIDVQGLFTD